MIFFSQYHTIATNVVLKLNIKEIKLISEAYLIISLIMTDFSSHLIFFSLSYGWKNVRKCIVRRIRASNYAVCEWIYGWVRRVLQQNISAPAPKIHVVYNFPSFTKQSRSKCLVQLPATISYLGVFKNYLFRIIKGSLDPYLTQLFHGVTSAKIITWRLIWIILVLPRLWTFNTR